MIERYKKQKEKSNKLNIMKKTRIQIDKVDKYGGKVEEYQHLTSH